MNGTNISGDSSTSAPTGGETEEERIAAMFQANSEVWNKTQEHMATYVYNKSIIVLRAVFDTSCFINEYKYNVTNPNRFHQCYTYL